MCRQTCTGRKVVGEEVGEREGERGVRERWGGPTRHATAQACTCHPSQKQKQEGTKWREGGRRKEEERREGGG